ncbi:unnamed protein product, partial [Schistosoma curassoni]|uniref:Piwi domain-containing protein n=1 Tax=Schistosoma curassoni TaxID=6186 RepID=A0A183KDI5_9TREM
MENGYPVKFQNYCKSHSILRPTIILASDKIQMVVGGSQQETLDPGFVLLGTRQQGV